MRRPRGFVAQTLAPGQSISDRQTDMVVRKLAAHDLHLSGAGQTAIPLSVSLSIHGELGRFESISIHWGICTPLLAVKRKLTQSRKGAKNTKGNSQRRSLHSSLRLCSQPIMPCFLPVQVRPRELAVCPRSYSRRRLGAIQPAKARKEK